MTDFNGSVADLFVFIGRFQPFHNGHLSVIRQALKLGKYLNICIGSANAARRVDYNPFTSREREKMIRACLTAEENVRVYISHVEDSDYNPNDWVKSIQYEALDAKEHFRLDDPVVRLIGHSKDKSSYYMDMFPRWEPINVPNYEGLSATPFRLQYFSSDPILQERALLDADGRIPDPVLDYLWAFRKTADYANMVEELAFTEKYKKAWESAPYPPIFVTTDAVVVQSGHILLIQRKANPGKGLWALPGGFLERYEEIINGIFRELKEETSIKVPLAVLKGSMVGDIRVFDSPYRSSRGRTITNAALIHLPNGPLPKIRAADDAADAKWWPIAEIRRDMMMEDHMSIINNMIARL